MKRSIIYASMAIAAGVAITNIYNSIVDVPAWGHNIPASITTATQYYAVSNPGNFFRIFSPLTQALALLSVLLFWKRNNTTRYSLLAAFLLYFAAEGMTFMYFYPRNAILFGASGTDATTLQNVWQEWSTMNWVRTLLVAAGVVCSAMGLHMSYKIPIAQPLTRRRRTVDVPEPAMA